MFGLNFNWFSVISNFLFGNKKRTSFTSVLFVIPIVLGYYYLKIVPDMNSLRKEVDTYKLEANEYRSKLMSQIAQVRIANSKVTSCMEDLNRTKHMNDVLREEVIDLQTTGVNENDETEAVTNVFLNNREGNKTKKGLDLDSMYKVLYKEIRRGKR